VIHENHDQVRYYFWENRDLKVKNPYKRRSTAIKPLVKLLSASDEIKK
jgi:hypothetical protein